MNDPRRYAVATALCAVFIGMIAALLTPITDPAADEPLSTNTAFRPLHIPSVSEPPPDGMRNFVQYRRMSPTVVPVVPSVRVPAPLVAKKTLVTPKPKAQPVTAPVSPSIDTVIQFALSQQRKPYKWGAAGPNAYDCSGLVLVSFSMIGIRLPHYTGAMISMGKAVSRSELRRGDIVFPQRGHVGIYLGNNQFIHAPQPGDVVKISTLYAFYAARRM